MGQKINPHGMRVGINKTWDSVWIAGKKDFAAYLLEDNKIREFILGKYKQCAISRIQIERSENKVTISLYTARPGMVIGQKGAGVEQMKKEVAALCGKEVAINVVEVKYADLDAQLVAESVVAALNNRMSFRRAVKQALNRVVKAGAKGVKIMVSGRLDGADIARSEHYQEGSLPLQTIRADIDYGFAEANVSGRVGVKVWIYKGEILGKVDLTKEQGGK